MADKSVVPATRLGKAAKRGIYAVRHELFDATPPEVWREYFANGYTWAEAVNEELSYAETED